MTTENSRLPAWVLDVLTVSVWGVMLAVAFGLLDGCTTSIPHRSEWEVNHGQGRNPATDCPGQYKQWSNQGSGGFVIGCWGQNTER
jgi:hypothetical protein